MSEQSVFPEHPEFPGAPPPMGHNRPPVDEQGLVDFNDAIDQHEGLRARIPALLASCGRAKADSDETVALCADLIKRIAAVESTVERERKDIKEPYLEAGRKIDAAARTLVNDLSKAKVGIRNLVEAYMRDKLAREQAEQRRIADQQRIERERLESLALAELQSAQQEQRPADQQIVGAAIAVPVKEAKPEPTQVRSLEGALATTKKVKVAVITDWPKAFRSVKNVPAVQEAVQRAINGLVRAGQANIPGVEIKEDVALSVR